MSENDDDSLKFNQVFQKLITVERKRTLSFGSKRTAPSDIVVTTQPPITEIVVTSADKAPVNRQQNLSKKEKKNDSSDDEEQSIAATIDQQSYDDMFDSMFEDMKSKYKLEQNQVLRNKNLRPSKSPTRDSVTRLVHTQWNKIKRSWTKRGTKLNVETSPQSLLLAPPSHLASQTTAVNTTTKPIVSCSHKAADSSKHNSEESPLNLDVIVEVSPKPISTLQATGLTTESKWRRNELITELLQSEQRYVDSLRVLVEEYMIPLSNNHIISEHSQMIIFKHFNTIVSVNEGFLNELKQKRGPEALGFTLNNRATTFKLYIGFINNYPKSVQKLAECCLKDKKVEIWLNNVASKLQKRSIQPTSLYDYLSLPLQRTPQYAHIFSAMLQHTPETYLDYPALELAFETIKTICNYCKDKREESDNATYLVKLQDRLGMKDLVQPTRKFVKEGPAVFHVGNGSIKCLLYLFSDFLLIDVPDKSDRRYVINFSEEVQSVKSMADTATVKNALVVTLSASNMTVLSFDHVTDRNHWIAEIKGQVKLYKKSNKEFAFVTKVLEEEEKVMKKGWLDTFIAKKNIWKKRYYVLTNRYIHVFGGFGKNEKGRFPINSQCKFMIEISSREQFRIENSHQQFYSLRADTGEDMFSWCSKLMELGVRRVINENIKSVITRGV